MLRLFRKQEMLRIGLRDLLGKAGLRETVEDLSDLAEVCLQKAYAWADAGLTKRYGRPTVESADNKIMPAGFAIIAMGKLGGRELNFSSDVDLMYVYSADGETEGASLANGTVTNKITNHQYFIKLAEKLSAAIGEKTEDGFVFRVDLVSGPRGRADPWRRAWAGTRSITSPGGRPGSARRSSRPGPSRATRPWAGSSSSGSLLSCTGNISITAPSARSAT